MKHLRKHLWALFLALALCLATAPAALAEGEHQTEVPEGWVGVWTVDDLYDLWTEDPGGSYIQMADIEFADGDIWMTIGTEDTPFTGTYDGNGYTIRNLQCSSTADYQGLFGYAFGATLKNITLADSSVSGGSYVGGIVGYAYGATLENITLADSSVSGGSYVGGIVGYMTEYSNGNTRLSAITDCVTESVTVTASGDSVGGIAGGIQRHPFTDEERRYVVTVSRCSAGGTVTGFENVGGIVGKLLFDGERTSQGSFDYVFISECRNEADVSCNYARVGGVAGALTAYSYSYGGYLANYNAYLQDCYNTGKVCGSGNCSGILGDGRYNSYIRRCYSVGEVTGDAYRYSGIVGYMNLNNNITFSYYLDSGESESLNTYGTAVSESQLKRKRLYEQYDFDGVWTMEGDPDYAYAELRCFTVGGTVAIAGEPVYDAALTADVSGAERLRSYTAAWYADGALVGTGEPFTVPAEAVGKTLTLVITGTDAAYRGSLSSEAVTVGKAACLLTPLPSEMLDKSTTAILVSTDPGQEYSLDGETWQMGGGFSGLEPGTAYTVYTRIAETELYLASPAAEAVTVTTTAQWQINQYTITFVTGEGSEVAPITQVYGTEVTAPREPILRDHSFDGWYLEETLETEYVFDTMPGEDITLYAKWKENDCVILSAVPEGSSDGTIPEGSFTLEVSVRLPEEMEPEKVRLFVVGYGSGARLLFLRPMEVSATELADIYSGSLEVPNGGELRDVRIFLLDAENWIPLADYMDIRK